MPDNKLVPFGFDKFGPPSDVATPGSAIETRWIGMEIQAQNEAENNNLPRIMVLVKNKTGAAITTNRVLCYAIDGDDYEGKVVGKLCDAVAERAAGVLAPDYAAAISIPINALFWIQRRGPATAIIGDINSTITRGQPIVTDDDADGGKVGLAAGGNNAVNQIGYAREAAAGTDTEIDIFMDI